MNAKGARHLEKKAIIDIDIFFVHSFNMILPYGLPERSLQALLVCWVLSSVISTITSIGFWSALIYLMAVAIPAIGIYSIMSVSPFS